MFGILGCMKIPSRIKEFSAQKIVNLMTIFLCSEILHPHPKGCGFRICISDIIGLESVLDFIKSPIMYAGALFTGYVLVHLAEYFDNKRTKNELKEALKKIIM